MQEYMVAGDRGCSWEEKVHMLQEWLRNRIFEERGRLVQSKEERG